MNPAIRLRHFFQTRTESKDYLNTVSTIIKTDNKYKKLSFLKYFIADVQKIEFYAKQKGKNNQTLEKKLSNILHHLTSCTFQDVHKQTILSDLDILEYIVEDEINYSDKVEELKIKIHSVDDIDTFSQELVKDMKETLDYYSFFGNNIIKDSVIEISTKLYAHPNKTKKLSHNLIISLLLFLELSAEVIDKTDDITQNLVNIKSNMIKLLPKDNNE